MPTLPGFPTTNRSAFASLRRAVSAPNLLPQPAGRLNAPRARLEIAATPTKQTIELISNRNTFGHPARMATLSDRRESKGLHPFTMLPLPALIENLETCSLSSCYSLLPVSKSFATRMETKIPVTHRKQSSAHSLVRYTSRPSEFKSPSLSPPLHGAIMDCSQSFKILPYEAAA